MNTRIYIYFTLYPPPKKWEFLVVTEFLCRWTRSALWRSAAATLDRPDTTDSGLYSNPGTHNPFSAADAFHMVLNEWHIKFFLFQLRFVFATFLWMPRNISSLSIRPLPGYPLHWGLFMRNATHSFLPVCQSTTPGPPAAPLFVIVLPTVQFSSSHTPCPANSHWKTWLGTLFNANMFH